MLFSIANLEAEVGIEPAYTELQSVTSCPRISPNNNHLEYFGALRKVAFRCKAAHYRSRTYEIVSGFFLA